MTSVRCRLVITGIVQGVGFRPFVYRLARDFRLGGWVLNSTDGVVIEAEGVPDAVDLFVRTIPEQAPARAKIERIDRVLLPPMGYSSFAIEESLDTDQGPVLISPDICICEDCLRELRDSSNRRYDYPFINCTNCGPRFTIVRGVPYDRPRTAMSYFHMCTACEAEYRNPANRRFHAEPNACPTCGPRVWLTSSLPQASSHRPSVISDQEYRPRGDSDESRSGDDALKRVRELLAAGQIVAIKGLGGFHLACDATDDQAVGELRRRKRRSDKPFAVMSTDADSVATYCYVSESERQLLESPQRPIVLLRRKKDSPISSMVAPGNNYLGVTLPYTPLHYLLFEAPGDWGQGSGDGPHPNPLPQGEGGRLALVMTSGNLSEEPIATGNREALERLASLADAFLLHDRDIEIRCDDSVTRVFRDRESVIRRSRGYAPFPVRLGFESRGLLACGGHLKNTFCVTRGNYAFLSQHIGDLENAETMASFAQSVEHFRKLFRVDISAIAHDLHPEYLSTRYAHDLADSEGLSLIAVQHHHAHVAACVAENGLDRPVIGVAFDGTGYGDDGNIWGGEFLICEGATYRRAAHLKYVPLPGGDVAVRHPYRVAASYLVDSFGVGATPPDLPPLRQLDETGMAILTRQIERRINSPLTSSAGRLFDAVSSLIGVRHTATYEGQAAIELEMIAQEGEDGHYDWDLCPGDPSIIDMGRTIREVVEEWRKGTDVAIISAKFHNTVADIIMRTCCHLRDETGIANVALSGGVFQNIFLLERACRLLERRGFSVLLHHQVPANDGGIALGQAVVANLVLA